MISPSCCILFTVLSEIIETLNNTVGPVQSATNDAGSAPQSRKKVMTLLEKAELLDMYQRLKSAAVVAHHLMINDPA